ncbi:NADH:ubiquinone oxidoreductase, NADH-binding subunit (chain F) [Streptomyces sp. TLI_053]|uniref:NADH-quinone oxidoreductase subunit NuoF family protein n=1 Tax=Streptomyces sp. TLI_053 TaxID=1855352 RepID=UPI00087C98C9|nr:NADH-quinone oxidoreductase subunit NuoF family protein [Streptomyces sp. TLI_053]SDT82975.1 NADH:ubiquinone oxidoreductase, NADH-binding subunit (chain F) [Streptomyces sp. TLI_053]
MNEIRPTVSSFGPARLLAGTDAGRLDRARHLAVHGPVPVLSSEEVVTLTRTVDLRGRGGAGFPFARKFQAVVDALRNTQGDPAVVVNGAEGEPSCLKDTALLLNAPHLVLDGAEIAAVALRADEVAVGVARADVLASVQQAMDERRSLSVRMRVEQLPERFVTGEGSALTNGLNNNPALPSGRKVRTSERGLNGRPTLLSNTETFAQLAVAARLGAQGYAEVGLPDEPGTAMLTVAGEAVVEAPTGAPLTYLLQMCGMSVGQGLLVGGYHGMWLSPAAGELALVSREALKALGATLGAGAVLPLPEETCPLGETARVARYMAGESAQQCGPCVWGLARLADELEALTTYGGQAAYDAVFSHVRGVLGRGACSHPDGTSRFVSSALKAFPEDVGRHVYEGGCGRPVLGVLPVDGKDVGKVTQRLLVDWTLCRAHGLCADVLPGVVQLGPDGYPSSADMPLKEKERANAVRAVRRCPALALRVVG